MIFLICISCNHGDEIQREEELEIPADTSLVVNQSRTCKKDPVNDGAECNLQIGKDLELQISAVDTRSATIFVDKAGRPETSDYYIGVLPRSHCVRIDTGGKIDDKINSSMSEAAANFIFDSSRAWLSPYDAKAYGTSDECEESAESFLDKNPE